jgi:hypothetical protein
MRFKSFKSFTLGKSKESPGDDLSREGPAAEPAPPAVNETNEGTGDLDEISQKIPDLTAINGIEEEGPHGPLVELAVEPEDRSEGEVSDVFATEETDIVEEEIKVVETSVKEKDEKPEPAASQGDAGNSLSGLFSEDEEEVNPLANLIKSLPEYTAQEIIEDLNEIQKIIREWRPE